MDFILIRVRQHGQALIGMASEDDFVKSVGFTPGDERDAIFIAVDGINCSIEVHRWKMLHQGLHIRPRASLNGPPLRSAAYGEHPMVLHEIQNKV